MTEFHTATDSSPRDDQFRPLLDASGEPPLAEGPTSFQREISAALADEGHSTHINDRPDGPSQLFWDVGLGVMGIASLLAGVVLVFFFAAAGSIMLVLGGLVCAMAFSGATRSNKPPSSQQSP